MGDYKAQQGTNSEAQTPIYKPYRTRREALILGGRTALFGGLGVLGGYALEFALKGAGYLRDKIEFNIVPSAAKLDKPVTKALEQIPGGRHVVEADKSGSGIWERWFGITPKKQKAWREKRGIEEPGLSQEYPEKMISEGSTQVASLPDDYYMKLYGEIYGRRAFWFAFW